MTGLGAVVAVAENGVIGKDGTLPWRLPADLAHFKRLTLGGAVIMGRRTFQTLGKPLTGRRHIVLTRDPQFHAPGATVVRSPQEALDALAERPPTSAWVIGGAEVYRALWGHLDRLELTLVHARPEGDTRMPADPRFDRNWRWVSFSHRPADAGNPHAMTFVSYRRRCDVAWEAPAWP